MRSPGLVATGLGLVALVASAGHARAAAPVLFAAHRGGSLLWAENSLLAFGRAAALGADFLEFDVHLSRDGEPVVIHDATLDRTSTGRGPVRERTLAELKQIRLRDSAGTMTEEPVPTLEEVVRLAASGKRQLLLEIKVDERKARYPGIEEKVLAVLDRHAMAPSAVIMAFEADSWRRVRALRPDIRTAALYAPRMVEGHPSGLAGVMDEVRQAGVAFIGLHQALVDARAVALARKMGLGLGVWTVNEREAMRRFIDLGVGIVITDRPDWAKDLLAR
ncbi:MAG: glycerophosphodiester phosphodiesterase [Candidatus Rokubacteria bacterium]|nr:glycerophosphodiester phosphodiesterase [Candidatus Rokubacteria bacterium]